MPARPQRFHYLQRRFELSPSNHRRRFYSRSPASIKQPTRRLACLSNSANSASAANPALSSH
jgi:hypothetical protein